MFVQSRIIVWEGSQNTEFVIVHSGWVSLNTVFLSNPRNSHISVFVIVPYYEVRHVIRRALYKWTCANKKTRVAWKLKNVLRFYWKKLNSISKNGETYSWTNWAVSSVHESIKRQGVRFAWYVVIASCLDGDWVE